MCSENKSTSRQSVSEWLDDLKEGDSFAAQRIWSRYLNQLVKIADRKLGKRRLRLGDGEDVAIVAFTHFLSGVAEGRFPELDDRDDLWQVLMMLTDRKAKDHLDRERAFKRGADRTIGESAADPRNQLIPNLDYLAGNRPAPEFAVQFAEEMEAMFAKLEDTQLARIASAKLQGFTNQEIAAQEEVGLRTIERRLALIRRIWVSSGENE